MTNENNIRPYIPPALSDRETRSELAAYYKWIVSLAILILTVTVALVGFFPEGVEYEALLIAGWILLAICIFLNWFIIKKLVTVAVVLCVPEEEQGPLHWSLVGSLRWLSFFGTVQTAAFLLGILCIALGFILNLISR